MMEFVQVYVPDSLTPELLACRVCFVTGVKLYSLHHKLAVYYEEVTGIHVSRGDGLPQHVCALCAALLRRAADVCARSKDAHHRLLDYVARRGKITTQNLQDEFNVDRSLKLSTSVTETVNYPEILENPIECDQEKYWITSVSSDNHVVNTDFEIPENIVKELEIKKEVSSKCIKKTAKVKTRISKDGNYSKVKEYCLTNIRANHVESKKQFCQYILDKYIEKTLPVESLKEEVNDTGQIATEIEDQKSVFYEYIKKKYIDKNMKEKKIVNITKCGLKTPLKINKTYKTTDDFLNFEKDFKCNVYLLLTKEQKIALLEKRKDLERYKDATFKCELCYTGFTTEKTYRKHMMGHDVSAGPHECEVCHVRYGSRQQLKVHVTRHSLVITCTMCDKESYSTAMAKLHFNTHTGQKYECEHCGKVFNRYKSRLEHRRRRHGSRQCPLCYARCTPNGLTVHYASVHREKFPCTTCGTMFATAAALDTHGPSCGDGTPCARCGLSLPSAEAWRRHVAQVHSRANIDKEAKQHQPSYSARRCPACGQPPARCGCGTERRYICEYCAKSFLKEIQLRAHQLIHTGEKPFACDRCEKTFRLAQSLKLHMNTHTRETPFQCASCPKRFSSYAAKSNHVLKVHSTKRHDCELCSRQFTMKYKLRGHQRVCRGPVEGPK